ncbi:hypothetical protein UY3_04751 [Chelonia mydas]|uniref:Uncharacterized protein n=1 Tax=Chelonia mydas TaxID=8469 RepID=M7C0V6_CHEMY|nr:hypothetical protein UY3_04751 [Chelonia mydas]
MSDQAPRSTSLRSARSTQEMYDGYQSYYTICREGKELLLCSNAVPRLPAAPRRHRVTVTAIGSALTGDTKEPEFRTWQPNWIIKLSSQSCKPSTCGTLTDVYGSSACGELTESGHNVVSFPLI